MLFNSPIYIFLFLPISVVVYYTLNRKHLITAGKTWLVLCSFYFYAFWNEKYLLLIILSILFNFGVGSTLNKNKSQKKLTLTVGIIFNLALLAYYKYTNFFIDNINAVSSIDITLQNIALPLAISFFTFQQIAYLVDSYDSSTPEYDFLSYCLFVTFFPQLVAGPIVHHSEMMPQFSILKNKLPQWKNIYSGIIIFSLGLFKKVVIADTFAIWADVGFDSSDTLNLLEAWGTSLSYTLQLYYDFSGYTDMAIGAALLFNIKLPINFNSPYKALNIQDFWQRWHITLSRWLRDYLYIPLGGNRVAPGRTYFNVLCTFLLGGLWHGAGWNFIIWGGLHGIGLIIYHFFQTTRFKMPQLIAWFITFNYINFAWVFFRAENTDSAIRVLKGMFNVSSLPQEFQFQVLQLTQIGEMVLNLSSAFPLGNVIYLCIGMLFITMTSKNSMEISDKIVESKSHLAFIVVSSFCFITGCYQMLTSESKVFLYFNF